MYLKQYFSLATLFALVVLAVLFYRIITQGIGYITSEFFQNFGSRFPEKAGIKAALIGSIWLMCVVAPVSIILGVGTAIYLEEYAKKNKLNDFIRMNISNLAGVPSVVFGLLGLTIFVRALALGNSILAAGFTMSLLILPVIIVAAQEAIRAVPQDVTRSFIWYGCNKMANDYSSCITFRYTRYFNGSYFSSFSCSRRNSTISSNWYSSNYSLPTENLFSQFTAFQCKFMTGQNVHKQNFNMLHQQGFLY